MAVGPLISQNAYFATNASFFALAVLVAIARITVRGYKFRRVYIDDYLLLLALATLISSNTLLFISVPELYFYASASTGQILLQKNFFQAATDTAVLSSTAGILSWIAIFAVKFSFLFYFRPLVERLPRLTLWWRVILAVCIPVAVTSMCSNFIACPHVGMEIISHCFTTPDFSRRARIVLYYGVVSDILTDALIISIPILLLRQTHLNVRRKVSLGILLCLSMFMIAIAMVRGISARVYGTHDQIWSAFWLQLETSISVIMVSTMIFKTLFVGNRGSTPDKNSPRSRTRLWRRKPTPQLPAIHTGATMTGMRTMIRENGITMFGSFGKGESISTVDSGNWRSINDDSTMADRSQV